MNTGLADRQATSLGVTQIAPVAALYDEEAFALDCDGEPLLGVLSKPSAGVTPTGTALVIVVGGPQYRVGAHRQFVNLARALAGDGHAVLRFDRRGMGDSSGAPRGFEDAGDDIRAAIGAIRDRLPSIRRLVLFGLCDGASAALLCLRHEVGLQVDGLCLLNPWVRSTATLARTHLKHYYRQRFTDPTFWRKLLAGSVGVRQGLDFLKSWRLSRSSSDDTGQPLSLQQAMAISWRRYRGPVLLMLSDEDLTAHEFLEHANSAPEWHGLLEMPRVSRVKLAGADHTLSEPEARTACEDAVRAWLLATAAAPRGV